MIILTIFRLLKKWGYVDELFVLAKRRIVYDVWPAEIKKWHLKMKVAIVHGKDKEANLYKDADVRLMNYEGLEWLKKQKKFFKRGKRIMLAVDESSKLKHTNTVRFRSLKKIIHHFRRRYIMTGSPAPNGLMGLFGQVYTLDLGETFGRFITEFRNEYFQPAGFMGRDWQLQDGAKKRIFKRLKPMVIRYSTDELDMPPLTFLPPTWVKMPKKARHAYDEMEKELIIKVRKGEIVAANSAVASQKCRQIANGGIYHNERSKGFETLHDAKNEALVDILEELNGEPALISFEFQHDEKRLQAYFKKHAPQFADAPFVGGRSKDKQVRQWLKMWDKGKLPAMFGQPDSVAHGLNLQGRGGIVIYYALTWNLENYEQFYQRVWRQGQKRRVLAYRLAVKDTVDEDMIYALRTKDKRQQALLRAMERRHGLR